MSLIADPIPAIQPKLARELKQRMGEIFARYSFEEVMVEVAKQKPKSDIYICPAGAKLKCPHCQTVWVGAITK